MSMMNLHIDTKSSEKKTLLKNIQNYLILCSDHLSVVVVVVVVSIFSDEFAYDQTPRSASTVHELLDYFLSPVGKNGVNVLNHHLKYMQQIRGLVGIPGFQADCSVSEKEIVASNKSDNVHRAVLSISPHGLDEGVRIPRKHSEGAAEPNFTALFDRPFLFLLRSANPENPQILYAGVINDVFERNDFTTKYPLPEEWSQYKDQVANTIKQLYSKYL